MQSARPRPEQVDNRGRNGRTCGAEQYDFYDQQYFLIHIEWPGQAADEPDSSFKTSLLSYQ